MDDLHYTFINLGLQTIDSLLKSYLELSLKRWKLLDQLILTICHQRLPLRYAESFGTLVLRLLSCFETSASNPSSESVRVLQVGISESF